MEQGKSIAGPLVLTVIITAIVVGGGVYFWQKNQPNKKAQTITETPVKVPTNSTDQSAPRFSTIDEYVSFAFDPKTSAQYKTSQPNGLVKLKDVTPKGADFIGAYVWAKSANASTFYIQTSISSPEEPSQETNSWYGPFTGDLNLLLK